MRGRAKPEGIVLVVGSCAEGFSRENNTFGDLLYTIDDAKDDLQASQSVTLLEQMGRGRGGVRWSRS